MRTKEELMAEAIAEKEARDEECVKKILVDLMREKETLEGDLAAVNERLAMSTEELLANYKNRLLL